MNRDAWHLVTGEYPPQAGGVSDYSRAVAEALAADGTDVHVWCPGNTGTQSAAGVHVHRVAGTWSPADLTRLDREIDQVTGPRRLLVQWVPHAFGRRSMNVAFCRWVRRRGRAGDRVEIMIHEPFLAFREGGWAHDAAAAVHRVMVLLLLSAANRVWVSVPAWADCLRPWALGRDMSFCWLPVPSNIPVDADADAVFAVRQRLAPAGELLIGHFGTYGRHVAMLLDRVIGPMLDALPRARLVLLGRGSAEHAAQLPPEVRGRVHGAGELEPGGVSRHLQACDLLVQPYPDGVSTRRSTIMAPLAHGCAIVTTLGRLSEPFWATSPAISAVGSLDAGALLNSVRSLAADPAGRMLQRKAARALYDERFDLARTIAALQTDTCTPVLPRTVAVR